MLGMNIKSAQAGFFDRKSLASSVDKATRRVLSKFGAFVRTGARSSIRKRKSASPPGKPPSSHVGLLKKFIFFSYEPSERSVVIGPALLNRPTSAADGLTIPQVLEEGGPTILQSRSRRARRRRRVQVAKRPFMGPAFEAEIPKVDQMWKDAVR